jgi:hypothetical protein
VRRNSTAEGETSAPESEGDQAILASQQAIRTRMEEIYTTNRNQNDDMMQRIQRLTRIVARIGNRPAQINRGFVGREHNNSRNEHDINDDDRDAGVLVSSDDRAIPIPYESTLSANPRDLYTLWEEYEFGIEGRKSARKFSSHESGRVKYKYHRRKVIWDLVSELLRSGHTNISAVDSIYDTYGREATITSIINTMRRQRAQVRRIVGAE